MTDPSAIRISVVIPTRNLSAHLSRALASVAAQTRPPFETIVVSPTGPTPNDLPPPLAIRWLVRAHGSPGAARNAGAAIAGGTHVAFLDDDDSWHDRKLELTGEAIARHPEAGLFYSSFECMDDHGRRLWVQRAPCLMTEARRRLAARNFIGTSTVTIRRTCFEEAGGFDDSIEFGEDWDLWMRIAGRHAIVRVKGVLTRYEHLRSGSVTGTMAPEAKRQSMVNIVRKVVAEDPALEKWQPRIDAALAHNTAKFFLIDGRDQEAARGFFDAWRRRPSQWQSVLYLVLALVPALRRMLPPRLRVRLLGHHPRHGPPRPSLTPPRDTEAVGVD